MSTLNEKALIFILELENTHKLFFRAALRATNVTDSLDFWVQENTHRIFPALRAGITYFCGGVVGKNDKKWRASCQQVAAKLPKIIHRKIAETS